MQKEEKSIKSKFFIRIVPIVVLMIISSYFIMISISMKIINSKTEESMELYQEIEINSIQEYIEKTLIKSKQLASFVESTYKVASINEYEDIIFSMVEENKNILGVGIWFEPYVYDENEKFFGPYAVKKDDETKITYNYSNETYNYFDREYYKLAKKRNQSIFTEPFYDEVSESYMLSFVSPFRDSNDNFIGCVSIDIEIDKLQKHLAEYNSNISTLYIINDEGVYIANEDIYLVEEKINALKDENSSFAEAVRYIVANNSGVVEYNKDGYKYNLYFATITELNWKIIFEVSVEENTKIIRTMTYYYGVISFITLFIIILAIVITVNKNIHIPINELLKEIENVSKNEYSTEISSDIFMKGDEFSLLGRSFGQMKVKLQTHQIELYKQMKDIEYLSYCDQLTGLRNRRYADEMLKKLMEDKWFPISIIVADINGLKLINDAFGHDKGDELLNNFATVLKQTNINKDYLSKTGGDEFMIYLPHTEEEEAKKLVEKINEDCKEKTIHGIPLTASLGVCTLSKENDCCENIIKTAEEDMYRNKIYSSLSRRQKNINLILSALYKKDIESKYHSKRVAKLCRLLAMELELSKEVEERVYTAGRFHDIGKMGISPMLLNKETAITEEEFSEIKKHSEMGYRILKAVGNMNDVAEVVFAHHEKIDGSGYPRGLKGNKISIEAKIVSIAEAYDDMVTDRKYKKVMTKEEAKKELLRCSGTQFDTSMVKVFVEKVIDKFE